MMFLFGNNGSLHQERGNNERIEKRCVMSFIAFDCSLCRFGANKPRGAVRVKNWTDELNNVFTILLLDHIFIGLLLYDFFGTISSIVGCNPESTSALEVTVDAFIHVTRNIL